MDNIELLRKLVDEDAITFIKANKKNYDAQLNSFESMNRINGQGYLVGIDLAEIKDMTAYSPLQ